MKAEIIAVGSELLGLGRRDANGDWLVERLQEIGIRTAGRALVEDDVERISSNVRAALERSDVVLLTGGLGPTADDRTREALALALDRPLERDLERVRRLGVAPGAAAARQADRPSGSRWIENPLGSAPGVAAHRGDRLLFALPGVPAEMQAMFRHSVLARLLERPRPAISRRSLLVAGLREMVVDERIAELYDWPGVEITILVAADGVELHLVAAPDRLDELEHEIRRRLGPALVGRAAEGLPAVVGRLLVASGATLATAESCTAGLLAATITSVAGASAWYRGGLVLYADDLKTALAGVRAETLREHGAVSEATARELARAACERCGADAGIGITGIAGPGGGTADKPVGRVHVGLEYRGESHHERYDLGGGRETVRRRSVALALDRLRRRLLENR